MIAISGVKIDLTGIDALNSEAKQRNVTLKAVKAAGKIVAAAARANTKAPGPLRSSVGVKAIKGEAGKTVALAVIGARKSVVKMVVRPGRKTPQKAVPAFYAHLVELGTRAHAVGKGSKLGRSHKPVGQQSGGQHPGTKPQPFLKPALESTGEEAGKAAMDVFARELEKAIAKQLAKGK